MKLWLTIVIACSLALVACTPIPSASTEDNLRIITEVYPPYNFTDKNNNVVGQSTEIVQMIMKQIGVKAAFEVMPLADGLSLVQKGPNMMIFSLNRTPLRENQYKWVGTLGDYTQAFYTYKNSSINLNQLEDAKTIGKIGVYKGDAGNQFLSSQGFSNLDESQTDIEALKKLSENKVQVWLGNIEGLEATARQAGINPDDLVLLPKVIIQADLYMAFSKDISDDSVAKWQKALNSIKLDKDTDNKTAWEKIHAKYSDPDYLKSLLK